MSILLYILAGTLFLAAMLYWAHRRATKKIAAWATRHGYVALSARWVSRWSSPFPPIPSNSIQQRETYRLKVKDQTGAVREGWLSLLYEDDDAGLSATNFHLPDEETIWDDEPRLL